MYRISFNPLLFLLGLVSFLILLPALVFSQPSGEIDPYSIHWDGTTTTTARIPLEFGISVPTGNPSFNKSIRIGTSPSPVSGQTSQLHIASDDSGGYNQFTFAVTSETSVTSPFGSYVYFQGGAAYSGGGASAIGGGFEMTGGRGYGGGGGSIFFEGGRDNSATAGNVVFQGGATTASLNRGYVKVGQSGTPNKFSLTSDNAKSSLYINQALEVDGAGYFDSTLNVAGTTTLASSLTSILYGNAGVVTNATISAPLAFSAGTLSFNQGANFTWTGTHLFQNTTTIADDVKFYIGDNSNFGGNISFENDQDTSGSLLVSAENGFAGEYTYATGLNVRVEDNFYFGSSSHTTLGLFGAVPSSPVISPTGTTDGLAVRKSTISSGIRALSVQAEWDVRSGGTSSSNLNGFNAFAFTSAAATTGITTTTQGGGVRNRQVVRQRSTAGAQIAKMSAGSNQVNLDAGVATVTTGVAFNAELPVVGAGSTLTNFFGFLGDWPGGTVSGTITTAYGMFLPALGVAGTNYELWLDTDAGIFLRESGNQISSPSAGVIQYDATTRHDFNNTVRVNSLTASRLVKTDGSKNLTSLSPSSAYTPTNVTTDRSYDANATKLDELADVLGTLIADLQTAGILQ